MDSELEKDGKFAKAKEIRFKHSEINHLLCLVDHVREDGIYWGRKDYFYKRMDTIEGKLLSALKTPLPPHSNQEEKRNEY